jgi:GNAT superfamily N-acetyltransferase
MNLSIRMATVADYDVFVRLHAALEVPDPPVSAEQFTHRMLPNVVLACDDGAPIGYAHWLIYGTSAHLIQIVVDAAARRRGVGCLLMQDIRTRALTNGCTRWYLNVKVDNAAAIRLYQGAGLAMEQRGWAILGDWASLQDLPGTTGQLIYDAPEHDLARFAEQHAIDPGDSRCSVPDRDGYLLLCGMLRACPHLRPLIQLFPVFIRSPLRNRSSRVRFLMPCGPTRTLTT